MEKLMIYMPVITPRADYIFTLMIRDLMGAEMVLTDSREEYLSYKGPRMEYSAAPSGNGIFFWSQGLLGESQVRPQSVTFSRFRDLPAFFPSEDERSAFPFDPFAAAFYLVARYEEYLPFEPDRYGRFRAADSIASKGGFLEVPLVNLWTGLLRDLITAIYPGIRFRGKKYRFVPTIDIDHAYAYKGRRFLRTMGGYGRSVLHGNWGKVLQRTQVLLGFRKDPYDYYDYILEVHERCGLKPLFFVLFASYGKDDNNVSLSRHGFRELLRSLDSNEGVGIHPSLTSTHHPGALHAEIKGLSKVLHRDIRISRQHFLKNTLPGTYLHLLKNGITDDYSMGYASTPGFRAGIADPFPFFDLVHGKATSLVIHPVALMDVTMKDYLGLTPGEAKQTIGSFVNTIKSVNGEFVAVWHNESFDETGRWKGWDHVFEDLLEQAGNENPGR
jgi:hypothetical protein